MSAPEIFAFAFGTALAVTTTLRVWLARRQLRHVLAHREAVPAAFATRISLADHRRAADYTAAKLRLGMPELAAEVALLLALTFGGGLAALDEFWRARWPDAHYLHALALFGSVGLLQFLVGLPFALWRIFRIEAQFGFNRMTPALFVADLVKQLVLVVVIAAPLLLLVLWLVRAMGELWWWWAWLAWFSVNLLMFWLYPTLIAPLFNTFTPLAAGEVRQRIEALLARAGFPQHGLYVMDGSKRSTHGNAYFAGLGTARRIVFYDTLLDKLSPPETEAVLAHELGHHHHRHIVKRLAVMAVVSLALFWGLAALMTQPWFTHGLNAGAPDTAKALLLFSLVLPVFGFPVTPLIAWLSRRQEYQADAFAARHSDGSALVAALVKLYRDNAATLTPDPLYSLFYDSHPPASLRIAHLETLSVEPTPC